MEPVTVGLLVLAAVLFAIGLYLWFFKKNGQCD